MRIPLRAKRLATGLGAMALAVTIGFGTTYSWNHHALSQTNELRSHTVQAEVKESTDGSLTVTPGGTEKKQVSFQNTGSAPAFLRVAYSESWTAADGGWLPNDDTYTIKPWTWGDDWELKSDGWYYYKKVLPPGASTNQVLASVSFGTLPEQYAGASYDLYFKAETVQASDEAWVNSNATLSVFGRTGTVTNPTYANGAVASGGVTWS